MTITSVRIYYYPRDRELEGQLTRIYWGFAEWFERQLKPIKEHLRGPEAKGVNIVNFMLFDDPEWMRTPNEWKRIDNTFEYDCLYNMRSLLEGSPMENIQTLMRFTADVAERAPWPQVTAVGRVLAQPLSDDDRASLTPFLRWPRGEP